MFHSTNAEHTAHAHIRPSSTILTTAPPYRPHRCRLSGECIGRQRTPWTTCSRLQLPRAYQPAPDCSTLAAIYLAWLTIQNLFALASSVLGTPNTPKLAQTQQPSTPHSRAHSCSRPQRARDTNHTQACTNPAAAYVARPHPTCSPPVSRSANNSGALQQPPQSFGLATDQDVASRGKEPSPSEAGSPGEWCLETPP